MMQLLVRLSHSRIDPNWLPAVERENRSQASRIKNGRQTESRDRKGSGRILAELYKGPHAPAPCDGGRRIFHVLDVLRAFRKELIIQIWRGVFRDKAV
jgi:hypothetical protein